MSTADSRGSTNAPTRRTVLRAGAHAAWAVPAIQIAAATPAFATSTDAAQLMVTVTRSAQSGAALTLTVTVTARGANAKAVNLNVAGSVAGVTNVSFGAVSATAGVTRDVTVTLSNARGADGVVVLTATGLTDNVAAKPAISGQANAYAASDLAFANGAHSYTPSTRTARLSVDVTSRYAPAKLTWTATVTPSGYTSGAASGEITVPCGTTTVPLTWTWPKNVAGKDSPAFTVHVTSVTANAGGRPVTGTARLDVSAPTPF